MKMTVLSLTSAALLVGAGSFAASAQAQESFQYPQGYVRGADLDHLAGAYAKGIIPVAPNFRLYGLAGFSEVEISDNRESGLSYGAGAEMDIANNVSIGADYMRYLDESAYDFDAASVGLRYRF